MQAHVIGVFSNFFKKCNTKTSRPHSGLFGLMMPYLIFLFFSIFYVSMQTFSIYAGDSGELVTAAYTWSIAHPPGYPLYVLLGNIISRCIPIFSVAWRVGLLSSIPMALSLFFIWKTVYILTKSKSASSSACVVYGFLYPVWLYAIVPEVFGLFSLFSALLLYLFILFLETKKSLYVFLLAFFSGLSLTHHHLILFLLISIGMSLVYSYKKLLILHVRHVWKYFLLFFLGFCVYLYAPIASSLYPPLDWEHAANPMGFFRLLTRASYGTFKATYGAGESLIDRGLNLLTLGEYSLKDFTYFGMTFFIIGLIALWKKKRPFGVFFTTYLVWQLFYFFYAGFRLTSDFALGTLERFFIIPYQIISILIGIGVWGLVEILRTYWQKNIQSVHVPFLYIHGIVLFLSVIIPMRSMKHNYIPLKSLQNDTTLEKLTDDIFASTPYGSILNLMDDTSIFAVLHGYYVQKKRPDIRLVMFPQFRFSYYPTWLKRHYADVAIPSTPKPLSFDEYINVFIEANYPLHPIVNERFDAAVPYYWVPKGLVVIYYPDQKLIPSQNPLLQENVMLWNSFQDPFQGVIGVYKHMMLGDVLRYYASKRLTLAQSFLQAGDTDGAQKQMSEALRLTPDRLELFVSYIEDLIKEKKCAEAKYTLENIKNIYVSQQSYLDLFHRIYITCPDLQSELQGYEEEFQQYSVKSATKIE